MDYFFAPARVSKTQNISLFGNSGLTLGVLVLAVFFVPIIFSHASFTNQLLIGTVVNACLAVSALSFSLKKTLPVIILPALGALASGIIFGSFTIFLVYLVPFIWLGNALFVYSIKALKLVNKTNYALSTAVSSALKALVIFVPALIMVSSGAIPELFLVPMGLVQFATALSGGLLAGVPLVFKK